MPVWSLQFNGNTYTDDNFNGTAYAGTWYNFFRDVAAQMAQSASATSATDITVAGSGSLAFSIQQNKPFAVGQPIRLARTSAPTTTYMDGIITAYTPTTGNMTISIVAANGVGTGPFNDWTLSIGGARAAVTLPLGTNEGGTGATTISVARTNLGATTVGSAIFTATDAAAVRTTLGLGSLALLSTIVATTISDSTSLGRSLLTAASTSAARTALGSTGTGDALFTAASASAARSTLGLGNSATLNTDQLTPPGIMAPFAGSSPPSGWLLCDGSAVSRATYAALFAVIGSTYGAGDGSTTFNLPNAQDVALFGASGTFPLGTRSTNITFNTTSAGAHDHGGVVGGTAITIAQMPAHTHSITAKDNPSAGTTSIDSGNGGSGTLNTTTGSQGGGAAHDHTITAAASHSHSVDVTPPKLAINVIIKT